MRPFLLLVFVPMVLADPAIAFDGGWYDKEKQELSTDQSETLRSIRVSPILHGHPMTMWEVAELMEDLATAF